MQSAGQPIDAATRGFMEPRFGHDFSHIRVHTDERAADSARAVQAQAYTVGHHVVFNENQFAPTTPQGRELLAHELAHAVQQRNSSGPLREVDPSATAEASATEAAANVVNGGAVSAASPGCDRQVQRAPVADEQWKNDTKAARYRGQVMSQRIKAHGKLSREARAKINEELAYFEGSAKETYLREVQPILRKVVEIEMPAVDMRPEPPEAEPAKPAATGTDVAPKPVSDYDAMAAYYAGTRQSQLDAAAAAHKSFREQVPDMKAGQIDSQWDADKGNFVAVASSPGHRLEADQMLMIWRLSWNDRWKAARSNLIGSRHVDAGHRSAAEEAAQKDEESASFMLQAVNLAQEILLAANSRGKHLTLEELNQATLEAAKFHQAMVSASGMIVPGGWRVSDGLGPRSAPPVGKTTRQPPIEAGEASPPPAPTETGGTSAPSRPAETIKASPPPPPARRAETIKASPPPPPGATRQAPGGRGPAAVTDAEIMSANVRDPSSVKPSGSAQHQQTWDQLGGSGPAPSAFRDGKGNIHVSEGHWLLAPPSRAGIPPVSPGRSTPPAPAGQAAPQGQDIGKAKTQPPPSPPPAPAADPLAKTPAAPVPDPAAKAPPVAAPVPPVQQPAKPVSPQAPTGGAAAESQRPQASRSQPNPPQAISAEGVDRIRNLPRPGGGRKGAGNNVGRSVSPEQHQLAWQRLGGHGDAPPAFIYDGQVYLDPARWPPGK